MESINVGGNVYFFTVLEDGDLEVLNEDGNAISGDDYVYEFIKQIVEADVEGNI